VSRDVVIVQKTLLAITGHSTVQVTFGIYLSVSSTESRVIVSSRGIFVFHKGSSVRDVQLQPPVVYVNRGRSRVQH